MKYIKLLLITMLIAVSVTGCGSNDTTATTQATTQATKENISPSLELQRKYYPYVEECIKNIANSMKDRNSLEVYTVILELGTGYPTGNKSNVFGIRAEVSGTNSFGGRVTSGVTSWLSGSCKYDENISTGNLALALSITSGKREGWTKHKEYPDFYVNSGAANANSASFTKIDLDDYVKQGYALK